MWPRHLCRRRQRGGDALALRRARRRVKTPTAHVGFSETLSQYVCRANFNGVASLSLCSLYVFGAWPPRPSLRRTHNFATLYVLCTLYSAWHCPDVGGTEWAADSFPTLQSGRERLRPSSNYFVVPVLSGFSLRTYVYTSHLLLRFQVLYVVTNCSYWSGLISFAKLDLTV